MPKQNSFLNMPSQYDLDQSNSRIYQGGIMPNTPHSRSETNFYRQSEYPPYQKEFEEMQGNFANHYISEEAMLMQGNLDRSFPQLPQVQSHTPRQTRQQPQNYVPSN